MNRLEQALAPARHDCARVTLERGDVTELGRVKTALDPDGQPIDGPAVEGAGAVLTVNGHRVFIPYVLPDFDALADRIREVAETVTGTQEAVNNTSTDVERVDGRVEDAFDEAHGAALAAAEASGTLVQSAANPLPTARRNGGPLQPGDLLYLTDGVDGGGLRIVGVRTWTGSAWVQHVLVAEHVIASNSIVGELIAAESEIVAPIITGGSITGAEYSLMAGSGGNYLSIQRTDHNVSIRFSDPDALSGLRLSYGEQTAEIYTQHSLGITAHTGVTLTSFENAVDVNAPQGLYVNYQPVRPSNTGTFTFVSDAAVANGGVVWSGTIDHNLNGVPTYAAASVLAANLERRRWTCHINAVSATQLTVEIRNWTSVNTAAGVTSTCMWQAVA